MIKRMIESNKEWTSNKWNYLIFGLITIGVYALYFVTNHFTPIILDDAGRVYSTFAERLQQSYFSYMHENGRIIAHSYAMFFASTSSKWLFNLINPVFVLLLIYMIFKQNNLPITSKNWLYILCIALFWFCLPDQYVVMHMMSGSVNYIWAGVIALAYIYILQRNVDQMKTWQIALFLCFSLIAGAWNEMFSIALSPAILLWMLFDKRYKNARLRWSVLLFYVGTAFVVLSPGNFVRLGTVSGAAVSLKTLILNMLQLCVFSWWSVLIILLLIGILITSLQKTYSVKEWFYKNWFWLVAIVVSLAFIFVTKATYSRVFVAIYLFTFILLVDVYKRIKMHPIITGILSIVLVSMIMWDFTKECESLPHNKNVVEEIVETRRVSDDIFVRQSTPLMHSRKTFGDDFLIMDSSDWRNTNFMRGHNLDSLSLLPADIYDAIVVGLLDSCYLGESYIICPCDQCVSDTITIQRVCVSDTNKDCYVFKGRIRGLLHSLGYPALANKVFEDKLNCIMQRLTDPICRNNETLLTPICTLKKNNRSYYVYERLEY